MKHHSGIILIIDQKRAGLSSVSCWHVVSTGSNCCHQGAGQQTAAQSLLPRAADLLKIPLQVFCGSSVAPPHIFLRRLLVHALLRHGHHQPRPVCVRFCPPAAEVSCCSSVPHSSTCLWECHLGLLPWWLPDQSDSRTGRWRKWARTSLLSVYERWNL